MLFFSFLLLPLLTYGATLEGASKDPVASGPDFRSMERSDVFEYFQTITPKKFDLTQPLRRVIPDIRKIPTRAVESCYEARFNNRELHLFKRSTTLFDVLYDYYVSFRQIPDPLTVLID